MEKLLVQKDVCGGVQRVPALNGTQHCAPVSTLPSANEEGKAVTAKVCHLESTEVSKADSLAVTLPFFNHVIYYRLSEIPRERQRACDFTYT